MTPESIEFLRHIGTPDEALSILRLNYAATITGDLLASYLRAAYAAGRRDTRDPYRWYSASELIDLAEVVDASKTWLRSPS